MAQRGESYVQRLRDGSFGSDRLDLLARLDTEEGVQGNSRSGLLISPLLLPHPDDDTDDETASPRLVGGSEYVRQNIYMAAWLAVLLVGYAVQRSACSFGLPNDCLREVNFYEIFSDVTGLALYGLALGWFVGINEPSRFFWLASRERWYAWATFLLTPPLYSAISDVDALKHSLVDFKSWGGPFIALWGTGMAAIALVVMWHIVAAWKRGGRASFAVYLVTRAVVLAWFAGSAAVLAKSGGVDIHLHHLYIGWALALWADFNEPLSAVTLAVGAGIFVQGIAAYSFAPVFSSEGCFETPAASVAKCKFWAEAPFTVRVCPGEGAFPDHSCSAGGGAGGGGGRGWLG